MHMALFYMSNVLCILYAPTSEKAKLPKVFFGKKSFSFCGPTGNCNVDRKGLGLLHLCP